MRVVRFMIRMLIATLFGVLIGIALGHLLAEPVRVTGTAAILLTCVLGPPLSTLVHEAGHLLAGRAAGMAPVSMTAGPLGFYWRGPQHRLTVRARRDFSGGFTVCVPPLDRGGVRGRMIIMVAGGPLASLLLALAAGAVWFWTDSPWRGPVALLGIISAAVFAWTALPYAIKGMTSDGAKIRTLLRNGPKARALCADLVLLAAARAGAAPASWPREAIAAGLAAAPGSSEHISALHFSWYMAVDAGDHARAEEILGALQEMTTGLSPAIAAPVAIDAAAFALFMRGDAKAARGLIEGQRQILFDDAGPECVVRAGLAAAAGNYEEAAILAKKARAALERSLFPGFAAPYERWLARVEAEIAEAAAVGVEESDGVRALTARRCNMLTDKATM